MKVGLLGGTFDPIHNGHCAIARCALERIKLNEVIFIPCGIPPHKPHIEITFPELRMKMVKIGLSNEPDFSVSDYEINKKTISYSIDTVKYFLKKIPKKHLFFIIGADTLYDLYSWKSIDELVTLCEFIVVYRKGFDIRRVTHDALHLGKEMFKRCMNHVIEMEPVNISSTEIKERIKSGASIHGMVPDKVENYILTHNVYKN